MITDCPFLSVGIAVIGGSSLKKSWGGEGSAALVGASAAVPPATISRHKGGKRGEGEGRSPRAALSMGRYFDLAYIHFRYRATEYSIP